MSPFVGRVVAGCRLRAVRCRSLSSTSALPVRPCKWQREERARVLREKLESDPNVLRVAIDCSLNSYYSMNEKVWPICVLGHAIGGVCSGRGNCGQTLSHADTVLGGLWAVRTPFCTDTGPCHSGRTLGQPFCADTGPCHSGRTLGHAILC